MSTLRAKIVALAAIACALTATATEATYDPAFTAELLYSACMASQNLASQAAGEHKEMRNHILCNMLKSVCRDHSDAEGCRNSLEKYAVVERSADSSFVLFTAAPVGNMEVIEAMIARSGNPNATIPGLGGWTPLSIAVAQGANPAVSMLLRAGGNPNLRNDLGRTALMFAASYGYTDIASELLDHGADPNVVPNDESGWTALFAAACAGRADVLRLLIERGADVSVRSKDGKTALACAKEGKHREAIRILENWQSKK